jgi:anhydro-N-acetylmuramic acid kinase
VIGLNSGTSADGLDLAAVKFDRKGGRASIKFLAGRKKNYPSALRNEVLKAMHASEVSLNELVYLDNLLGKFFGKEAGKFVDDLSSQGVNVALIASHGQTVRHLPTPIRHLGRRVRGTLQLGSPEPIATASGCMVVSDFRQADIAVGNEGAPITTEAVKALLADRAEPRLIVNIGGIANYFYFSARRSRSTTLAADCGPGNSLSDLLTQELFGKKFDRNGYRASTGTCSERLLSLLFSDPYYKGRSKSTGKEVFGESMAKRMISFGTKFRLKNEDLLATAVELTVRSIAQKIAPVLRNDSRLSKIYLTGGGRDNIFLVKRLQKRLPEVHVCRIDDLGISGDYVEAASYAVLGEACLCGRPMSISADGAVRPILGRITQAPLVGKNKMTGKSA